MATRKTKKKAKAKKSRTKKKTPKKKSTRKKVKTRKKAKKGSNKKGIPAGQIIGVVTHYFPHVQAAVVKLKKPLAVGDTVLVKGATTHFEQRVESIEIDHVPIQKAKKGDEIGLQVKDRVRGNDLVLLPN
jgi:putative protease